MKDIIDNVQAGDVLLDIPNFESSYASRVTAGDGGYTFIYADATEETFVTYKAMLGKAGFALYTENAFNAVYEECAVKNLFATYISKITQVDVEYHSADSRIYVTATPRTSSILPPVTQPVYTPLGKEYPTILTQFGFEDIFVGEHSMGYIIRIADGSFIIIDAGDKFDEVPERIYKILKKQAPDPDNIVISAWILTHAHPDHTKGFDSFARKYGNDNTITVKQIVYNFPDDSTLNAVDAYNKGVNLESISFFRNAPEILKPHTGNVLYYADVKFNVLYTQENYLAVSDHFGNFNTSSLVLQMITADGTKTLIAADHPVNGVYAGVTWCQAALPRWYGSFVESEVCTTFHHGNGGGANRTVYWVIKPKIVLWNAIKARVEKDKTYAFDFNKYFADPETAKENGVVAYRAEDNVQILNYSDGKLSVKEYDDITEYLSSK